MRNRCFYHSPIGKIWIVEEEGKIIEVFLEDEEHTTIVQELGECDVLKEAKKQLEEYFSGKRHQFSLPICLKGTEFQQRVWKALQTIPYGETRSYGEIAKIIGSPNASRAVGGANHRNPIMILVPCHRVIGAKGDLVGFGGGIEAKRYLLELEKEGKSSK